MAVSSRKLLALVALLAPLAHANAATAKVAHDRQTPILLDAQSTSIDLKTNSAVFSKIRISQGAMSITADQGQASQQRSADLYFENNVWNFRGNVKITVEQGLLLSDDAQITFVNSVLSKAVVNGKPASFEQTVAKTGKLAKGNAETIDYDAAKHLVRFLKNAYLSNGDNEIRGQSLKYDVLAQKVIAEAEEQNSQRVRIIITPPPPKSPAPTKAPPANPTP
jgi:lipopolysaccharide transport protein LptA